MNVLATSEVFLRKNSHPASEKGYRNVFPKGEQVMLVKYCYIGMQINALFLMIPVITAVEELTMYLFGGNQSCLGLAYAGIYMKWMITVSLCVLKTVNLTYFSFLSQFPHNLLFSSCLSP